MKRILLVLACFWVIAGCSTPIGKTLTDLATPNQNAEWGSALWIANNIDRCLSWDASKDACIASRLVDGATERDWPPHLVGALKDAASTVVDKQTKELARARIMILQADADTLAIDNRSPQVVKAYCEGHFSKPTLRAYCVNELADPVLARAGWPDTARNLLALKRNALATSVESGAKTPEEAEMEMAEINYRMSMEVTTESATVSQARSSAWAAAAAQQSATLQLMKYLNK